MLKEVWGLETLPTRRRCAWLERSGGASGTWSLHLLNQSSGKAEGPSSLPLLSYPNQTPSGITETIPFLPSIFSFPRTSVLSCLPSWCYTRVTFLLSYWLHDSTHSWLLSFCVATETQRSWITSLRLQTSHLHVSLLSSRLVSLHLPSYFIPQPWAALSKCLHKLHSSLT